MKRLALVVCGIVFFIIIVGPVFLKFHETFTNISPQSAYEEEINDLQKQVRSQLNETKKLSLSNEEIEQVVSNASLASLRLSEARNWVENQNLVDAQRYLNSAKNYLNENRAILRKGDGYEKR